MTSENQGVRTSSIRKEEHKITRENIVSKLPTTEVRQRDLIYFKNRMLAYEAEIQRFKERLEKYKKIAENRNILEEELLKKRNKICALQNALSDMQKCLFEERERSNKLQGEVQILKIQEDEYHQKVRSLLTMTADKKLRDHIIYTFEKPLGLQIGQRLFDTRDKEDEQTEVKQVHSSSENQPDPLEIIRALQKQNEAIQGLMQQQTSFDQEKIEAMVKNCNISIKEAEKTKQEYIERIKELIETLKETEDELMETNTELLETKKALHREEVLRGIQKTVLLKNIEDAVNSLSTDDTINTLVDKVIDHVNKAFEKFETINDCEEEITDDASENNEVEINVVPRRVPSSVKFSEKLFKNVANIPSITSNDTVGHNLSTGKFIHYSNNKNQLRYESHGKVPSKFTSLRHYLSKNNSKGSSTSRVASAPTHQPSYRRNSLRPSKSNLKVTKKSSGSQTFPIRPKTADPRRRQKAALDENHVVLNTKTNDNSLPKPYPINTDIEENEETSQTAEKRVSNDDIIPPGLSYNEILQYVRNKIGRKRPSSLRKNTSHYDKQPQSRTEDASEKEHTIPKTRGGVFDPRLSQLPSRYNKFASKTPQISTFSQPTATKDSDEKEANHFPSDSHQTCEEKIKDVQDVVSFLNTELKEIHNQCQDYERASQEHLANFNKIEQELNDCKVKKGSRTEQLTEYQAWLEDELINSKQKLSKLESYRSLEMEGFQTEIKQLSKKVREMEKNIFKALLHIGKGEKDTELLKNIHSVSTNSVRVSSEVQKLKSKLYQIQNDMRLL